MVGKGNGGSFDNVSPASVTEDLVGGGAVWVHDENMDAIVSIYRSDVISLYGNPVWLVVECVNVAFLSLKVFCVEKGVIRTIRYEEAGVKLDEFDWHVSVIWA